MAVVAVAGEDVLGVVLCEDPHPAADGERQNGGDARRPRHVGMERQHQSPNDRPRAGEHTSPAPGDGDQAAAIAGSTGRQSPRAYSVAVRCAGRRALRSRWTP
jgi:hypothetical protein